MPSLPPLITAPALQQAVGSFMPLAQLSSAVQTLQNIQGFNPAAFSSLTGSIQSALQGFDEASNIVSSFAGGSPVNAFVNALSATGLAGSSVTNIANMAGNLINQQTSFLSTVSIADSFARLSNQRISVEQASRNSTNRGGALQFPADLGKYWIALGFIKYDYMTSGVPVLQRPQKSILLPVPINLQDDNQLEYSQFSMTEATTDALGGIIGAAAGATSKIAKMMESNSGVLGSIASAVKSSVQAAGVYTGYAVNTHQSMRFVQPTLKTHTLSWKLIASTRAEAQTLHDIIRTIKYAIYPGVEYNGLAYTYPDLLTVYLYNHDKMYVFKPAFVQTFSVNYTPDGGPAFFKSGHPFAVTMSMQIVENGAWSKPDIAMTP